MIRHIKHQEIDFRKWDHCINRAFNGIIYAYSWYLDIVSENWEALVEGDYESVMPLTTSKKYGIPYIFQPLLTQQLGVFSNNTLCEEKVHQFIRAIPEKFRFFEINLNLFNKYSDISICKITQNTTYQLDLIDDYEKISAQYNTNTKRNIKKAEKASITVLKSIAVNDLIQLLDKDSGPNGKYFKKEKLDRLRKILSRSIINKHGRIYGAYTRNNTLCAIAFFVSSHSKSIFLLSISSELGKQNRAMFKIVDEFIKDHSNSSVTLDFEGSNIPNIARFYAGFGATACNYIRIKKNNLPWYIKLFKK